MKQSVEDGGYVHDDEGGSNQAENSFTRAKKVPYNNVENVDAKAMQLKKRAVLHLFDCNHSSAFEPKIEYFFRCWLGHGDEQTNVDRHMFEH